MGLIEDIPVRQWKLVPSSSLSGSGVSIQSAQLPHSPVDPNYDNSVGLQAFSSACFDTTRNRFLLHGGGHNDYAGNEILGFDLDTLTWALVAPVTTPVGSFTYDTDAYSDGLPSSTHTYDTNLYIPTTDVFWRSGGYRWGSGHGTSWTWEYDLSQSPSADGWSHTANGPTAGGMGMAFYDSTLDYVFMAQPEGSGSAAYWRYYNCQTRAWSGAVSDYSCPLYGGGALDPTRRKIVAIGTDGNYLFDISSPSDITRTTLSTSGPTTMMSRYHTTLNYDPVADRIVGWPGSGTTVYTLNLDTLTWTAMTATGGDTPVASQSASPSAQTFRFRYCSTKNVYVNYNSDDGSDGVYIYRLTAGGGSAPPVGTITLSVR